MILSFYAIVVDAAPRGTPTIVTNDSTSPVEVSGKVSVFSKPVGIISATIGFSTFYKKSLLCASEFPSSKVCKTVDLVTYPGVLTVQSPGAWVMPTTYGDRTDIVTGITLSDWIYYNAGLIMLGDDIVFNNQADFGQPTSTLPALKVVCCSN